jgi:hypothetical protein
MSDDIVERLRKPAPPFGLEEYDPTFDTRQEGADEIERLRRSAAGWEADAMRYGKNAEDKDVEIERLRADRDHWKAEWCKLQKDWVEDLPEEDGEIDHD